MKKIVFAMSLVFLMNSKAQAAVPSWVSPGISMGFGLVGVVLMVVGRFGADEELDGCRDSDLKMCCPDDNSTNSSLQECVPQNISCENSTQLMCLEKPGSTMKWTWPVFVAGGALLFSGMIPGIFLFDFEKIIKVRSRQIENSGTGAIFLRGL